MNKNLRRWLRANPVIGSLVLGLGWGLACGSVSGLRTGEWLLSLGVWCFVGLAAFGPLLVYIARRDK